MSARRKGIVLIVFSVALCLVVGVAAPNLFDARNPETSGDLAAIVRTAMVLTLVAIGWGLKLILKGK